MQASMALTVGSGPLGPMPSGLFNFELPRTRGLLYFEGFDRRIRARFDGETVVDSVRVKLLHESGVLPVYYFPEADLRMDRLERTDRTSECPWKGRAVYWTIRGRNRAAEDAGWSYPEPIAGAPPLAGHIAFYWDAMDEWLEEDEPAVGHARDPYHRIDVLDTSRRVTISVAGEVIADTRRARVLFESSLPPRWYIPLSDVRRASLVPSDRHTVCAYKGVASYWSVSAGGEIQKDVVWYYPEPRHDALRVKDYLCFFNERVDIELDGELQSRPRTPWSSGTSEELRRIEESMTWPGRRGAY
jgi:uncharacterized protein (DUF427 family)